MSLEYFAFARYIPIVVTIAKCGKIVTFDTDKGTCI